jgi:hypothetical protein
MAIMSNQELDQFLAQCCERLEQRQTYLVEEFGIGQCDRFDLDLDLGTLTGHDAIGVCFRAEITPIGSYSRARRQWSWAWANPELAPPLQRRSLAVQALAEQTGLKLFQADVFESDEPLVLELTAMACQQLQAVGCYQVEPKQNEDSDLASSRNDTYLMLALTALTA